jgi:hypothetical protein
MLPFNGHSNLSRNIVFSLRQLAVRSWFGIPKRLFLQTHGINKCLPAPNKAAG